MGFHRLKLIAAVAVERPSCREFLLVQLYSTETRMQRLRGKDKREQSEQRFSEPGRTLEQIYARRNSTSQSLDAAAGILRVRLRARRAV